MKKSLSYLLAASLLACTACGGANASAAAPAPPAADAPALTAPLKTPAADTGQPQADSTADGIAVTELYSEDGSATDKEGTAYDYSYHVPQIQDDTPAAQFVNEEIERMFGTLAKQGLEAAKNKEVPHDISITYESYRSGAVLSLLIKTESYYGRFEEYEVYNYDVENGATLTTEQLLARFGITEEQYLRAARRAAVTSYDNAAYAGAFGPDSYNNISLGEFNERRAQSIPTADYAPELPVFTDNEGTLHMVAAVGSFGESEYLYQILPLVFERAAAPLQATYSDYLSATLRDGALTVTFTNTETLQRQLTGSYLLQAPPYGEAIPVHGAYSDYTDLVFMGSSDQSPPVLFLLTRDGRVEYLDLYNALAADYYSVIGPIPGVSDAVSFEAEPAPTGDSVYYAVRKNGERHNLPDDLMEESYSMSENFVGEWSSNVTFPTDGGGSYDSFYVLTLYGGGNINLKSVLFEGDITLTSEGSGEYLGLSEDGVVYSCTLTEDDGNDIQCTIALRYLRTPSGTEQEPYAYTDTLIVTELGRGGFIDTRPGVQTTFVKGAG